MSALDRVVSGVGFVAAGIILLILSAILVAFSGRWNIAGIGISIALLSFFRAGVLFYRSLSWDESDGTLEMPQD